jgi:Mrp family chromosome partitioning ATPase
VVAAGPSKKSLVLTGLLALVLGAFAAFAAAVVRDRFDDVVRDEETLEGSLGSAPVAGVVHRFPPSVPDGVPVHPAPLSAAERDLNALVINVRHLAGRTASQGSVAALVMVTSTARAGSSQLVQNLALAAAQQGLRVVEVDANPDGVADDANEKGLLDVLVGGLEARSYLEETGVDNLTRLPVGQASAPIATLFAGPGLRSVMRDLGRGADLVLLNAPTDAALSALQLIGDLDLCLVVARAGSSRRSEVSRVVERLRSFGAECVAGVLVNAHGHH